MPYNATMEMTTTTASERLGVTPQRVRAMIQAGRLPARRIGRDYIINEADLELVKDRKAGRPKQTKQGAKA
jgi:excisionase family DNA binding protein